MRVSQIQNLTWAGNVAVLAGLGWVGLQFWEGRKDKGVVEWTWEKVKSAGTGPRWPGELTAFGHIWGTPVNGKVPPPPAPPVKEQPKVDRAAEFKSKLKFLGGFEFPSEPERSEARLSYEGKEMTVRPGAAVAGFQLTQFSPRTTLSPEGRAVVAATLVFKHPDTGLPVTIEQQAPQGSPLADYKAEAFRKGYGDAVKEGVISETGPLANTAFLHPETNAWIIPEDEQLWIEAFGEKHLWPKLATKPDVDAAGVSHGLRIVSFPEQGTPLAPSHGIGQGDVVRSINGVAITSKEDVAGYLRGAGKGLDRYEVVIETDGKARTVVYRVPRPRRVAR